MSAAPRNQVAVNLTDRLIVACVRGCPTEAVLQECQAEVLSLVRDSGIWKVLYDALDMEPPPVSIPWVQRALDEQLTDIKLRRAIVVPNTKIAFLARIAFGEGDYRVFYEDKAAAIEWLTDENVGLASSPRMRSLQTSIATAPLPASALLQKYVYPGAHTDCYFTEIARPLRLPEYVDAFYTTWVFKLERFILSHVVNKPSTDLEAHRLAHADTDAFAAWSVEARTPDQLLMCDYLRRTRSWLMVAPIDGGTRLYFGSAVVPVRRKSGEATLGSTYVSLMGFHKLYSRILLRSARSRLRRKSV